MGIENALRETLQESGNPRPRSIGFEFDLGLKMTVQSPRIMLCALLKGTKWPCRDYVATTECHKSFGVSSDCQDNVSPLLSFVVGPCRRFLAPFRHRRGT